MQSGVLTEWAIDRGVQDQRIIFIARDLGGDELAQKGAEGLGILTSDRTQVLDATERVESLQGRSSNSRVLFVPQDVFESSSTGAGLRAAEPFFSSAGVAARLRNFFPSLPSLTQPERQYFWPSITMSPR
jgi:hypothetical protein